MLKRERDRLATVRRFLQMKVSKEDEIQQIVDMAAKMCGTPLAMVTIIDDETQYVRFKIGTQINEVPYADTICQHTLVKNDLLVISDTLQDERVKRNPFVVSNPGLRFYAGSPLKTQEDHNIGTLCVFDVEPKTLSSIQEKMLLRLGKQVSRLLEFDASLQLLKDQYESSIREETKLRSFFESSCSCHLLLDKNLIVLSYNKKIVNVLSEIYGISLTEGMSMADYVEPDFLPEFTRNCKKSLLGEVIIIESVIDSPLGKMSWHLAFEPALDATGAIIGVSYSATDITQAMQHKKTVIDQMESFRQINHIISAELHQPLDAAMAAMDRIKQKGFSPHIEEFLLLEKAFDELSEKRDQVLSADKSVILK